MKENLINDKEQAFLSKRLATIEVNAPVEVNVEDLAYEGKLRKIGSFYKEMDFKQF